MAKYQKRKRSVKTVYVRKKSRKKRASVRKYSGVPSGMPRSRRANLRYCTQINIVSTAGAMGNHLFRCNSPFDPDLTGVGHQPMGYDQWTALFNHYVVVGAKITVWPHTTDAGADNPSVYGIYLNDSSTAPYTSWEEYREAKKGNMKTLMGGGTRSTGITAKFGAKKFYNVTDIKDNFARLGSGTGTNPTEVAFFDLWFQSLNASNFTMAFNVQIDYIVDFSEPKNLAQS